MTHNAIELPGQIAISEPFDQCAGMVSKTVSSGSARVYAQTFAAWSEYCTRHALDRFTDLTPGNVWQFLADGATTTATRQRQLSAFRKFAELLAVLDGEPARRLYDGLKLLKAPKPDDTKNERNKTALSPAQADALIRVWRGTDAVERRNAALVRLLLFTGVRRSELAALEWRDVDFENGVVYIRHGKRDKARQAAIMDNTDGTLDALRAWRDVQTAADQTERRFVFCGINKAGRLETDKAITDKTVERVVKETARRAELPEIAPHDIRRTHITEFLASGGTLADAQAQAGHAHGETTLRYAQATDAAKRRRAAHFRFGAVPVAG